VGDGCLPLIVQVLRPQQTKGFVLLKTVGGRAHFWLVDGVSAIRDYELLPQTSETFIYLAMIRVMVRRLT